MLEHRAWFRKKVVNPRDCNSRIGGSNPPGTSKRSVSSAGFRVSDYESEGHRFESYTEHQSKPSRILRCGFFDRDIRGKSSTEMTSNSSSYLLALHEFDDATDSWGKGEPRRDRERLPLKDNRDAMEREKRDKILLPEGQEVAILSVKKATAQGIERTKEAQRRVLGA